ncbi:MAG: nitroreductase family protein [Smithella sp.]
MPEISRIIQKRVSCRTYADTPVEENLRNELERLVAAEHTGPFGNKPKFQIINLDMSDPAKWKNLGTYGVIKNARLFLAGKVKKGNKAVEDYGYCMECLILKATALGLGTCWLAGTFSAGGFAGAVNLQKNELLPAVSPIGYPAQRKSLTEKIFRLTAKSDRRKPWPLIFFIGNFSTPLTPQQAGKYSEALENVRLAPSACNKQPWRILLDTAGNAFHFYLQRTFGYKLRGVPIQDIDMGIAMNHFEFTLRELEINGQWIIKENVPRINSLDYIVSWQEDTENRLKRRYAKGEITTEEYKKMKKDIEEESPNVRE